MMQVYLKPEVDIDEICSSGFIKNESNGCYELRSEMDEYIIVNPITRIVNEYGYDGLLYDWITKGYIQGYEHKSEKEELIFPYTIGNMIFNTKQELIDWVMYAQKRMGFSC